jgi:hypothetical protein
VAANDRTETARAARVQVQLSDPAVVALTAAYFVLGGLCWMLSYTLTLARLPSVEVACLSASQTPRLLAHFTAVGAQYNCACGCVVTADWYW